MTQSQRIHAMFMRGKSIRSIARAIGSSEKTVEDALREIMQSHPHP